jgi:hypothetical protein
VPTGATGNFITTGQTGNFQPALGFTPLNKAGDSSTGNYYFSGSGQSYHLVTGLGTGTFPSVILGNTTLCTTGVPVQSSSALVFSGQAWVSGSATNTGTQSSTWRIYERTYSGTSISSELRFDASLSTGVSGSVNYYNVLSLNTTGNSGLNIQGNAYLSGNRVLTTLDTGIFSTVKVTGSSPIGVANLSGQGSITVYYDQGIIKISGTAGTGGSAGSGSQTPWTGNINGGGYNLTNVSNISGQYHSGWNFILNASGTSGAALVFKDVGGFGKGFIDFYTYGSQYIPSCRWKGNDIGDYTAQHEFSCAAGGSANTSLTTVLTVDRRGIDVNGGYSDNLIKSTSQTVGLLSSDATAVLLLDDTTQRYVTLPYPSTVPGRIFRIKNEHDQSAVVDITTDPDPNNSSKFGWFDNTTQTLQMTVALECYIVQSDGAETYYILSHYTP